MLDVHLEAFSRLRDEAWDFFVNLSDDSSAGPRARAALAVTANNDFRLSAGANLAVPVSLRLF